MDLHQKADRLHDLGHEVAAAALRRSQYLEPKLAKTFRAFRQMSMRVRGAQPGFIYHVHPMPALRVGRHVGPVTREEWLHHTGRTALSQANVRSFGYDLHPLAAEGHGLHESDPSSASFKLLRDNLDKPHVWPIVADHFEEDGGKRAVAMAHILRGKTEPTDRDTVVGPWSAHVAPVTWPIRLHEITTHPDDDMERYVLNGHKIAVPKHLNTKEDLQ